MIQRIKEDFLNHVKKNYTDDKENTVTAGLIAGMTIGDRSMIDAERYQQFMDSGLVHLIAVSGGNIAIVVLFAGLLLFRVPFYIRQVILMACIVFYALIVGDDSSILRATVMGLLTILALFPGRQISIWRSMAYAWIGMLCRNPYYLVYDLGFLLSFAALAGIVMTQSVGMQYLVSAKESAKVPL